MKAIPVEVTFKKTNKKASMVLPVKQVALAMGAGYEGDSFKRITSMSVRAVLETIQYIEQTTGQKPDSRCMAVLKLLQAGQLGEILWTNGIRVYK